MKVRASATAILLSMTIPALLTEWNLPSPVSEPVALAQGTGATDPVTEVARQRYEEGVKAFDAGKFEDARTAFLQAYALKKHPAVLLNLGQSELKSFHYEDAGTHLQQFLRLHTTASPAQKTAAEKGIAEAKKKTGFIILIVDANGAVVSVDGTQVGQTPMLDPVFVKPGKHTIDAKYQSKSGSTQVDAKAGSATAASITLGTSGSGVAPTPTPAPTPEPTPAPAPTPAPVTSAPPSTFSPTPMPPPATTGPTGIEGSTGPTMTGPMGDTSAIGPDQTTMKREPFFHWYKRKPIAWIGTGVAGLGLIGGIAGSIAASSAGSSADTHAAQIKKYISDNDLGNLKPCRADGASGSDAAGFEQACDVLRQDLADYDTDIAISIAGWALLGVGAVGTTIYAMIDWYPKKNAPAAAIDPKVVGVVPMISSDTKGIGIMGTF